MTVEPPFHLAMFVRLRKADFEVHKNASGNPVVQTSKIRGSQQQLVTVDFLISPSEEEDRPSEIKHGFVRDNSPPYIAKIYTPPEKDFAAGRGSRTLRLAYVSLELGCT